MLGSFKGANHVNIEKDNSPYQPKAYILSRCVLCQLCLCLFSFLVASHLLLLTCLPSSSSFPFVVKINLFTLHKSSSLWFWVCKDQNLTILCYRFILKHTSLYSTWTTSNSPKQVCLCKNYVVLMKKKENMKRDLSRICSRKTLQSISHGSSWLTVLKATKASRISSYLSWL